MIAPDILNYFSIGNDQILAIKTPNEELTLIDSHGKRPKVTIPHRTFTGAVMEPQGRWFAEAAWQEADVRIWDASTGKLIRSIPAVSPACISLSPDGRLLMVGTPDDFRGIDTRTWQPHFSLPRVRAPAAWPATRCLARMRR